VFILRASKQKTPPPPEITENAQNHLYLGADTKTRFR
jgi:hypothetical protein